MYGAMKPAIMAMALAIGLISVAFLVAMADEARAEEPTGHISLLSGCPKTIVQSQQAERVALVVGNAAYREGSGWDSFREMKYDAMEVARQLCSLNFTVHLGIDLDRNQFQKIIADFKENMTDRGVRLFYYGGHGVTRGDEMLLIPVDVDAETLDGAVSLSSLYPSLDRRHVLQGSPSLKKILFINACRTKSDTTTLDPVEPSYALVNSFLGFATSPGEPASAGSSHPRHSIFAKALLAEMGRPGQTLQDMAINVRNRIYKENHIQISWDVNVRMQQFVFNPAP
jgi:hypothetical protein